MDIKRDIPRFHILFAIIILGAFNRTHVVNMIIMTNYISIIMITIEESTLMTVYSYRTGQEPNLVKDAINITSSKGTLHTISGLFYRYGKVCALELLGVKKIILFECFEAPSKGHSGIHYTCSPFLPFILVSNVYRDS